MSKEKIVNNCCATAFESLMFTTGATAESLLQGDNLETGIARAITNLAHLAESAGLQITEVIREAALAYDAERIKEVDGVSTRADEESKSEAPPPAG